MTTSYFDEGIASPYDQTLPPSTPLSGGAYSAKANAISGKITALLSSSFAGPDVRDALAVLDARGVTNNAETRKNLRQDAQKEVIDCNAEIVADFGKIAEQLKRIGMVMTSLNNTCDEIRRHIAQAKQETGPMLQEARTLMSAKKESEAKQEILNAFIKHFTVSDEDLSALTNSVEPVDDRFFAVLARVKTIHKDCEVLLESEDQKLGIELMEQTYRDLDAAFKKLYQWIQRQFKMLDLEDPHISGSIRRALRVLAERPTLFQNCLDFFAEARQHTLSDAFRIALTEAVEGSEGVGSAKPIEFSTHDLLRYLGDMLAWVHSSAVSERESLEGLFISDGEEIAKSIKTGKDSEPWSRIRSEDKELQDSDNSTFDGRKALNDLVNRNLADVCQTLRQRIEIAIRNNDDTVVIYKALHLLRFYHDIFSKLLGPDSDLVATLGDLDSKVFDHFEHILQEEAEATNDQSLPADLSVPTILTKALDRLGVLLKPLTGASAVSEVDRLLSVALVPFLTSCEEMAEEISDSMQGTIFRLNQGLAIRSNPSIDPSVAETSSIMQRLAAGTTALTEALVELQHDFLLRGSGLQILLDSSLFGDSVTSEKAEVPTTKDDLTIEMLQNVAARLDAFLPNAQMDALDNLKYLNDKLVAKEITEAAIRDFCKDFEQVKQAIEDHDEEVESAAPGLRTGHTQASSTDGKDHESSDGEDEEGSQKMQFWRYFPRTTAEIKVLLS